MYLRLTTVALALSMLLVQHVTYAQCVLNTTHCTCQETANAGKCLRFQSGTTDNAQCVVESCAAGAYACDCMGSYMCSVEPCGAWRPIAAGSPPAIGSSVLCEFHDASSPQSSTCITGPVALAPATGPVATCPGGVASYNWDTIGTPSSVQATPQVNTLAPGMTLSVYGDGVNNCGNRNILFSASANGFVLGSDFGMTNGECSSTPATANTFENYGRVVLQSSGFFFQPSFQLFDIDISSNGVATGPGTPMDHVAVIGFREGVLVSPTIVVENDPAFPTIVQQGSFTLPAAELAAIGITSPDITVPVYEPFSNAAYCTLAADAPNNSFETCKITVTFNEPIDKMAVLATSTYDEPANFGTGSNILATPLVLACS